ncbi:MAG: branched-chain amino acid ABC transporter permease [Planctomycetia bacterium]|jgi:branched-chain amino acid transport system permease protein|nr:branched-chain amino acid ABC transporter permease [Planctomycetia bacterium]
MPRPATAVDVATGLPARAGVLAWLRERWEIVALAVLALAPLVVPALGGALGGQMTTLFIYCILALGLNVMVGYTGLVHLGIAAFFGIGAYLMAILTVPMYPFQIGWLAAAVVSVLLTAGIGLALGAPTLRLRGDYLAIVTLGFGEVVKVTLRNLEQITGGMKGLNPVPPPGAGVKVAGIDLGLAFAIDPRWFYYLSLLALAGVVVAMRRLEHSRLGRAWVAVREDELAASAMGISATRVKLSAFAMSSAVAGLAGCLYAGSLSTTADPNAYDFNRSIMVLCAVILGGLGSIPGTLLGVAILVGFDTVLAPWADSLIQQMNINPLGSSLLSFSGWRLAIFGLALVLVMRYRPEGLVPSRRLAAELREAHP